MPRKIVFFGNCQAAALAGVYREQFGRKQGETVTYLSSYEADPQARATVAAADTAVIQLFDFPSKIESDLPAGIDRILFPSISASFLWPYGSKPHIRNTPLPWCPAGPYPGQIGDGFLNGLIAKNVPPAEAAARTLDLDVPAHGHIDRLRELAMQRQRQRDAQAGIETAATLEKYLPTERLFLTPDHPDRRMFQCVAGPVYERLGIGKRPLADMFRRLRATPFPPDEAPLHPALGAHWHLPYANDAATYRYMAEGFFTFAEYAARYAGYVWNEALQKGIHTSHGADPAAALRLLDEGLAISPRSLQGMCHRAMVLTKLRRSDEAEAQARAAAAAWPHEPDGHIWLSTILRGAGRIEESEAAARDAVAAGPLSPLAFRALAEALNAGGRTASAVAALNMALRLNPGDAHMQVLLAHVLAQGGRQTEATAAFRRTVFLDGRDLRFREHLAESLLREGDAAGALAEALAMIEANAPPQTALRLAQLLRGAGHAPEAASLLRHAARRHQHDPALAAALAEAQRSQGPDHALAPMAGEAG